VNSICVKLSASDRESIYLFIPVIEPSSSATAQVLGSAPADIMVLSGEELVEISAYCSSELNPKIPSAHFKFSIHENDLNNLHGSLEYWNASGTVVVKWNEFDLAETRKTSPYIATTVALRSKSAIFLPKLRQNKKPFQASFVFPLYPIQIS
jgi:hypothetical protein